MITIREHFLDVYKHIRNIYKNVSRECGIHFNVQPKKFYTILANKFTSSEFPSKPFSDRKLWHREVEKYLRNEKELAYSAGLQLSTELKSLSPSNHSLSLWASGMQTLDYFSGGLRK